MDRFDDIWKNRFNEDLVWEGILPHVAPKKKRPIWMIWLGIGIAMILLLSVLIISKGEQTSSNATASLGKLISEPTEPTYKIATTDEIILTPNEKTAKSQSTQIINEALLINISPKNKNKINPNNTYLKSNSKTFFNPKNISTDLILKEINPVRNEQSTLSISKKLENVIQKDGMRSNFFDEKLISVPSLNLFVSVRFQLSR